MTYFGDLKAADTMSSNRCLNCPTLIATRQFESIGDHPKLTANRSCVASLQKEKERKNSGQIIHERNFKETKS